MSRIHRWLESNISVLGNANSLNLDHRKVEMHHAPGYPRISTARSSGTGRHSCSISVSVAVIDSVGKALLITYLRHATAFGGNLPRRVEAPADELIGAL
jgi:hypothetical protein